MTSSRTRSFKDIYASLCGEKKMVTADAVTRECRDQTIAVRHAEDVPFEHWEVIALAARSCTVADCLDVSLRLSLPQPLQHPNRNDDVFNVMWEKQIIDLQRRRPPVLARVACGMEQVVQTSPHLRKLEFAGIPFGEASVLRVVRVLADPNRGPFTQLATVVLANLNLGDDVAAPIVSALLRLPSLTAVSLAANYFTDEAMPELLKLLHNTSSLTGRAERQWQSSLRRGTSTVLAASLRFDEHQDRHGNKMRSNNKRSTSSNALVLHHGVGSVATASSQIPLRGSMIEKFDLSFNEFTDVSLVAIADLFEDGSGAESLQLLNLQGNNFLTVGHIVDLLPSPIACPPTLTRVLFSGVPASLLPDSIPECRWTAEFDPATLRLSFQAPPATLEEEQQRHLHHHHQQHRKSQKEQQHQQQQQRAAPCLAAPSAKFRLPVVKRQQQNPPPPTRLEEIDDHEVDDEPQPQQTNKTTPVVAKAPSTKTIQATTMKSQQAAPKPKTPKKKPQESEKPATTHPIPTSSIPAASSSRRSSTASDNRAASAATANSSSAACVSSSASPSAVPSAAAAAVPGRTSPVVVPPPAVTLSELTGHAEATNNKVHSQATPAVAVDNSVEALLEDMEMNHALEMAHARQELWAMREQLEARQAETAAELERRLAERLEQVLWAVARAQNEQQQETMRQLRQATNSLPTTVVEKPVVVVAPPSADPHRRASQKENDEHDDDESAVRHELSQAIRDVMRELLGKPTASDKNEDDVPKKRASPVKLKKRIDDADDDDDAALEDVQSRLADLGW